MNREVLIRAGIDFDLGVARYAGDVELYEELLRAYLADDTAKRADDAFARKDDRALFQCAHELKGVLGSLDMTRAYEAACALVTLIRYEGYAPEAVAPAYLRMKTACEQARAGICEAIAE